MSSLLHRRRRRFGAPVVAPGGGGSESNLPTVSASWSDKLNDSYGVNMHATFGPHATRGVNAYTTNGPNYPTLAGETNGQRAIREAMLELGARHYRDRPALSSPNQTNVVNDLADAGVTGLMVMGWADGNAGSIAQLMTKVNSWADGAIDTLTGANEWNIVLGGRGGYVGWQVDLRAWQQALWNARGSYSVNGPAMGARKSYSTLGNVAAWSDRGDGHHYPGGRTPTWQLDALLSDVRTYNNPGQQVDVTETGYHNGLKSTATHKPTPENVAGIYGPRMILEHYRNPLVRRCYSYELVDQHRNAALDYHEDHFGLCAFDNQAQPSWRRKPMFHSIRRLLALCNDTTKVERDANTTYSPAALPLVVTGGGADLRSVLLGKRDGTYLLCLWRDVSIWTPATAAGTPATVNPVTITATTEAATVRRYRPALQDGHVGETTGQVHTVSVAGEVVVLAIDPA